MEILCPHALDHSGNIHWASDPDISVMVRIITSFFGICSAQIEYDKEIVSGRNRTLWDP